jgi:hypothetical protein
MKTFLCTEILTSDDDLVAWLGFVRLDFGDPWALAPVADGVPFDFSCVGSFDRLSIVEGESGAIHYRARFLCEGGDAGYNRESDDSQQQEPY